VRFVGGTKIFSRGLDDGRQVLVYAMNVELAEELAMILAAGPSAIAREGGLFHQPRG